MKNEKKFGFIYCRSTPTNPEITAICRDFNPCDILMGDFNLSHRSTDDKTKVTRLCQDNKINALKEITRSVSNNQLDYVFVDKSMKDNFLLQAITTSSVTTSQLLSELVMKKMN